MSIFDQQIPDFGGGDVYGTYGIGGDTASTQPVGENEVNPLYEYSPMQFDQYGRAGITPEQTRDSRNDALVALGLGIARGGASGTWQGMAQGLSEGIGGFAEAKKKALDKFSQQNIERSRQQMAEITFDTELKQRKLTYQAAKEKYDEGKQIEKERKATWDKEMAPVYETAIAGLREKYKGQDPEYIKKITADAKMKVDLLKEKFTQGGDVVAVSKLAQELDEMFPEAAAEFTRSAQEKVVNNQMLDETQRLQKARSLWGEYFTVDNQGAFHPMTDAQKKIYETDLAGKRALINSRNAQAKKWSSGDIRKPTSGWTAQRLAEKYAMPSQVESEVKSNLPFVMNWARQIPASIPSQKAGAYDDFKLAIMSGADEATTMAAYEKLTGKKGTNIGSVRREARESFGIQTGAKDEDVLKAMEQRQLAMRYGILDERGALTERNFSDPALSTRISKKLTDERMGRMLRTAESQAAAKAEVNRLINDYLKTNPKANNDDILNNISALTDQWADQNNVDKQQMLGLLLDIVSQYEE